MNIPIFKIIILILLSLDLFSKDLDLKTTFKQIEKQKLYDDPYWKKLLHYENNRSIILEDSFFLSIKGKTDPKAELYETIKSFIDKKETICRYPARYKWINSKLKLDTKKDSCKELDKFLKPNFKKMSLIFTSERYNSPASVFGHTFLKIETDTIPYAINYAAKVPGDPDLFTYAYSGINGKYYSRFKLLPYKNKDYEYKSEEFRDLFNFRLNLSKDQIENIMLHMYEIKEATNKYYFLSRNCSSQLIKLLDMADPNFQLSKKLNDVTIPVETVYILKENDLIKDITSELSKMKQFVLLIEQLDSNGLNLLEKIISNKIPINEFYYNFDIKKEQKNKIILSAIKYYEIESAKGNFNKRHIHPMLKLIKLKNKHKITSNIKLTNKLKNIPVSNHSKRVSLSNEYNVNDKQQFNFAFRYLYKNRFDLIDQNKKNGSVELMDISIRNTQDKWSLNYLTLVNLEAIPVSNLFFKETTNKITFGLKRISQKQKMFSYFDYGMGYKYKLSDNLDLHLYSKAGIYHHNSYLALASFENSFEYFTHDYISQLKYTFNTFSDSFDQHIYSFNNYYRFSKNITFKISGEYINDINNYDRYLFKLNYYF